MAKGEQGQLSKKILQLNLAITHINGPINFIFYRPIFVIINIENRKEEHGKTMIMHPFPFPLLLAPL